MPRVEMPEKPCPRGHTTFHVSIRSSTKRTCVECRRNRPKAPRPPPAEQCRGMACTPLTRETPGVHWFALEGE